MQIPSFHSVFKSPCFFSLSAHTSPLCLQGCCGKYGGGGKGRCGNHIYISHFIWIFLNRAPGWSQYLRVGIPSSAAQSTATQLPFAALPALVPRTVFTMWSQHCAHIQLLTPRTPNNPSQSQSVVLAPATQRDSPLSLPTHLAWHLAQSKPTTRYSIFSMTCRGAAKVGSSGLVPTLSSPVPALSTWGPVLTPLQHLPVESNSWRPVRV